jgi:hypothetical protein
VVAAIAVSCASSAGAAPSAKPAAGKVPAWFNDLASVYPEDQYLAFMGSGPDLEAARADAQSQLANFFGMTITAVSDGKVEYRDKSGGAGADQSELRRSVSQSVKTSSTQKLYAVKYSDAFTLKSNTYQVGYLVLKDTLAQIKAERKTAVDAATHYFDMAAKAPSVLDRHLNHLAGAAFLGRIGELDAILRTLKAQTGNELAALQENARTLGDAIKAKMTASVALNDPEGMVGNTLTEALTTLDIKPSSKGTLTLKAAVSVKPLALSTQNDLHTHEWSISLDLVDETGTTWFSNQASGRASGSSNDTAKVRARMEVEKFIKTQFAKSVTDKLVAKVN